ncbi:WD40 domain-containing protein [Flindersiella endophytica]
MARSALFISSSVYADSGLAQLPSAARDALELGRLFADPRIGPFSVATLTDPSAQDMRLALEELFADATSGDVIVLYVSGHGLKDTQGNLYFAAHDTRPHRLQSTAVSAQLLCSLLNGSRAEGAVVFLDCCYGGAFARGMVARAGGDPDVGDAFASLGAGARARAVITASSAIEYAFEGERLTDSHVEPSVFASAMRDGIADGDADQDGDGWVGLNELFDFIGQRIRRLGKPQTPHLWTFGASGDLPLTRNPRGPRATKAKLPAEVLELMTSPMAAARLGAVSDLEERATDTDLNLARAAIAALTELAEDDSLRVRAAATAALAVCGPRVDQQGVTVDRSEPGSLTIRARLTGPPIALDVFPQADPAGYTASVIGNELAVEVAEGSPSTVEARLRWAGGVASVPLTFEPSPAVGSASPPGRATKQREAESTERVGPVEVGSPIEVPAPAEPVSQAPAGASGGDRVDRPVWLTAAGALWLLALFLPPFSAYQFSILPPARSWLSEPITVIQLAAGLAAIGVGLCRYRWFRSRVSLAVAILFGVALQALSVLLVVWIAATAAVMGIGGAGPVAVLVLAGASVYLVQVLVKLARAGGARPDRPVLLVTAGGLGVFAPFLPTVRPAPSFAAAEIFFVRVPLPGLWVAACLLAVGIGVYRIRSTSRGGRTVLVAADVLAVGILVSGVVLMVNAAESMTYYGVPGSLMIAPVVCAAVYLVDPLVRAAARSRESPVDGDEPGKDLAATSLRRRLARLLPRSPRFRVAVVIGLAALVLAATVTAVVLVNGDHSSGDQSGPSYPEVYGIAFSPDGKILASGRGYDDNGHYGSVRLWNIATRKPIGQPLTGHESSVNDVEFSPDGKKLATASYDDTVRLWSTTTWKPIGRPLDQQSVGDVGGVTSIAFSPDGKVLAAGGFDKTIRLWDTSTGQLIRELTGHTGWINDIAFSPDGKILASAAGGSYDAGGDYDGETDGTVRLWKPATGQPIGEPLTDHRSTAAALSLAFSTDSKTLVAGYADRDALQWNVSTGQLTAQPFSGTSGSISSLAFSPDGTMVAGADSNNVRLWDRSTGQLIRDLTGHTNQVTTVAFSADGGTLASSSRDGSIRLWNPETGQLEAQLR